MQTARVVDRLNLVPSCDAPTVSSFGSGVDSTGMIAGLIERGTPPDLVIHADMSDSELPEIAEYTEMFGEFLARHGIPFEIVRYIPKDFKSFPIYAGLLEEILIHGTLPGITFSRATCSAKHKGSAIANYLKTWAPAQHVWAGGGRVIQQIGYSTSPRDKARSKHAAQFQNNLFEMTAPLQEWGWSREDAAAATARMGLPPARKSSCYYCLSSSAADVRTYPKPILRRIVLIEARAMPRLGPTVGGLWRRAVKGMRGATPKPASMTEFIRQERLLSGREIDLIAALAPRALTSWIELAGGKPIEDRPAVREWLELFDRVAEFDTGFDLAGIPPLFADLRALAEASRVPLAA